MATKSSDASVTKAGAANATDAAAANRGADTPHNPKEQSKPAPSETNGQMDDNVDDKGNKVGGGRLDQPT